MPENRRHGTRAVTEMHLLLLKQCLTVDAVIGWLRSDPCLSVAL